jgi:hypothetical protein
MFAKHRIKPRFATDDELAELDGLSAAEKRDRIRRMFRAGVLVPIRGASPDEPGDGGDDGDGAGDGDDDESDDVKVKLAKAEKAAAEKDKELRKLRREQEERERKTRESDGKFEELYKDEKARADRLEKELEDFREGVESEKRTNAAKSQVIAALKSAGVKNPERDVVHIDLSKIESETAAKRAAKKFADDNPDLLDKSPTRQKRGGGSDNDDDGDGNGNGSKVMGPDRLRRHFSRS